jgi:lipid II:glycine glycyltransferase (peptidoglycan interpeptide bridge formation enzyme)
METELKRGYEAEMDTVSEESWNSMLEQFEDASIFQTWPYEAVISGEKNVSHLILKKEGEVVAAAQARIRKVPLTQFGVAYIRWGPMWRRKGEAPEPDHFAQALRAIRNEYACRRRLALRILPLLFNDSADVFETILENEGFTRVSVQGAQRTLLVGLDRTTAELRKGMEQKWRNRLNRAEKLGVEVVEGSDDRMFGEFLSIYREMHGRKRYVETSDVNQFRSVQQSLPASSKMKIMIAAFQGKPAAGVICSRLGDMGIYLYGGTSDSGLNSQASYLLQWKVLCWLRETGTKWYNLNGINPDTNPGTYRFKAGLCGKNGKDLFYLGAYDTHENALAGTAVRLAGFTRELYRKGRSSLQRARMSVST